MDFGLLYENDKGEYVVLNDVRMAGLGIIQTASDMLKVPFISNTLKFSACKIVDHCQ